MATQEEKEEVIKDLEDDTPPSPKTIMEWVSHYDIGPWDILKMLLVIGTFAMLFMGVFTVTITL